MIKVFGIGNLLLSDDGIGVRVVEELKDQLISLKDTIEVFVGETDYLYCLDKISDNDFVIIVDGTYFETNAGKITVLSFEDCDEFLQHSSTSHDENLLKVLRTEAPHINGVLIGIEIGKVSYSLELSPELQEKFSTICIYVLAEIRNLAHRVTCENMKTIS